MGWDLPGRVKSLNALTGEYLARVDSAFRIHGDHVQAEELAPVFAHASQLTDDLAILAVEKPDVVVGEVGNV